MKRLFFTILAILVLVLFAPPSTVFADIAPPQNPPGSNLQPGFETTQVRMVAETVVIAVQKDTKPDSLGRAHVTADFTMRNLGNASESMAVRFPISTYDGRDQYPEITEVIIKVNGKQISFRRASYPDPRYQKKEVPWAEFDITFPVEQDVAIQVAYNLNGTGYAPYTAFYYILQTGAGWKDTIGSADVILRLPYPANPQNVIVGLEIGWAETTPGGVFEGNEVRWHFEDFEPGLDGPVGNMKFALVVPASWQSVLTERDNVAENPNDGEAWGRLAKAYKEIYFLSKDYRTDAGGEQLYKSSVEAYEKCLALKPNDAQWHAGFADLLANRSYFDRFRNGNNPSADTFRAFNEIRTALQLAPNDPAVLEIAQSIYSRFPDGMSQNGSSYGFPWLTHTPPPYVAPTIALAYDPAAISGTYESDMLTIDDKRARLILTLHPDYSVEMKREYENDQPFVSSGSWRDRGSGSLSLEVSDPNGMADVMVFTIENDVLHVTYSNFWGSVELEMKRLVTATPVPNPTDTPWPPTEGAGPSSQSPSPLCGSATLAPLAVLIWFGRKRRYQ